MLKTLIPLLSFSVCMMAQDNPLSSAIKAEYGIAKNTIVRAADKMPEENYGFKPTEDIRSFGQLVGHVADAQYGFCSGAVGEKSPATESVEKTKTSKADLVQALKDAFAYCDKAYGGMTDANAARVRARWRLRHRVEANGTSPTRSTSCRLRRRSDPRAEADEDETGV